MPPSAQLFGLSFCFCALLFGCSEPEDSKQVAFCKTVVDYVAFNPSDLTIWRSRTSPPAERRVEIEFEDSNEHGAKDRRRVRCEFGELGLMTEIWVDQQPMIFEEVRNLNGLALLAAMEKTLQEIRESRRSPFGRIHSRSRNALFAPSSAKIDKWQGHAYRTPLPPLPLRAPAWLLRAGGQPPGPLLQGGGQCFRLQSQRHGVCEVEELTLPSGPRVDIEVDDFDQHGAKQRHRITCDFDDIELMTRVVVDDKASIYEEVRNLNVEAFILYTEQMIEEIRASRHIPFDQEMFSSGTNSVDSKP